MTSPKLPCCPGSFCVNKCKIRVAKKRCQEVVVFACILILILFVPVSFLLVTLETLFIPEELTEMGIRLEKPYMLEAL
jgi:hypothetical protein